MPGKLVKILSGPHLGAEVVLGEAALTLGSDADCDVVVDDRLAGGRHVTILLQNGVVSAKFHEKGFVYAQGAAGRAAAPGESVQIGDGDLVAAGSTYFCVGPAEGRWPEVPLPEWVTLNGARPAADDLPKDPRDRDFKEGAPRSAGGRGAILDGGAPPGPSMRKAPRRTGRRVVQSLFILLVIAAFAIPAFLFTTGYWKGVPADASPAAAAGQAPAPAMNASLNELCQKHGLTLETEKGVRLLSGEVADLDTLVALRRVVSALAPDAGFRVYARSEMVQAATAVLSGHGYPIKVEGVQDGTLYLRGWAPSEEDWNRVLVNLRRDVPGVKQFDTSVMFLSTVRDAIAEDLRQNGLNDIHIILSNETLQCNGALSADKAPVWKECLARWKERFPVIREIKDGAVLMAAATPPETGAAPEAPAGLKIASVMFNPMRCFVTKSGASFYEGAQMPDGYVVESIGETAVVLRCGEERKELPLPAGGGAAPGEDHDARK